VRLKENTMYLVADDHAQIVGLEHGLYDRDTRFVSHLEWRVSGKTPTVLSTHSSLPFEFRQFASEPGLGPTQRLGIERSGWLSGASYFETVKVQSFQDDFNHVAPSEPEFLELILDTDFSDMFEVRGLPKIAKDVQCNILEYGLEYTYHGMDGVDRSVMFEISPMGEMLEFELDVIEATQTWQPETVGDGVGDGLRPSPTARNARLIRWQLGTAPLEIALKITPQKSDVVARDLTKPELEADYKTWDSKIRVENHLIQRVFDQSARDLRSLLFDIDGTPFPAAGIPWYVTPFGRDSIIVGLFTLPYYPLIAKGTLEYLASQQGKVINPNNLEAPGKILHEQRDGEASRTGRTPFKTYFGTVDATPLWICLLSDYLEWTSDLETVKNLEPHLRVALEWMASLDADPDQDGFIEYSPHKGGITNQVWKDSGDSTFDEHGKHLTAPIAVVEVQAYAYRARLSAARVFRALKFEAEALAQEAIAAKLKENFQQAFWLEDLQTYAHALDANKRPAKVKVSNPGHALWAGIVPDEIAPKLVATLFSKDMFSGWGIRTLALKMPRYNPVSYHNGSVWAHDNAMIALGLAKYGFWTELEQLVAAQLEAAASEPDARLPELFAGFDRADTNVIVPYPAACHPQAWDAAAPLAFLTAIASATQPGEPGSGQAIPSSLGKVRASAVFHGKPFELL
jgi:glycogen debranching enzyme